LNQELEDRINFINDHAPECDSRNEQTLWILINIKPDSSTPIAGWPEATWRWKNPLRDYLGNGNGAIPRSSIWMRRPAAWMETCQVIGQFSAQSTASA